jgi:serine/threonine protein kinase
MSGALQLQPGISVGNYRVIRLLGQGGMGAVYEVEHVQIGRRAAMKLLTLNVGQLPMVYQRFINEARAANQIDHPGVVQVFEFGQLPSGIPWMMMEYVPGDPLDRRIKQARESPDRLLPVQETLTILHQLSTILEAAHAAGIVHRDMKPQNVMLIPDPAVPFGERVRLLDFGIAKLLGDTLQAEGGEEALQTASGATLGTPAYMAPEQCKNSGKIDGKADVYAVGVMAYQMLCGRLPFWDQESVSLMATKLYEDPPPIQQFAPTLSPSIEALVMSMLARQPGERPTISQVEATLAQILEAMPPQRKSGVIKKLQGSKPPVTEQLEPPELAERAATSSLPIYRSGESRTTGQQSAPAGAPELAVTPSPLWVSAEQIPPSHPAPQLPSQSIGQLPTKPAYALKDWVRERSLWLFPILSLAITMGILVRPQSRPGPVQVAAAERSPPPSLQAPAVVAPADLSTPPDLATPAPRSEPVVMEKKSESCHRPTLACLSENVMSQTEQGLVLSALLGANIKLCKGERVLLRMTDRVNVRLAPASMGHAARESLVIELNAILSRLTHRGDLVIQCGK